MKKRTTLNLQESLWRRIKKAAKTNGLSASELTELMMEAGLQNLGGSNAAKAVLKERLLG